jgi:hypothetical protein
MTSVAVLLRLKYQCIRWQVQMWPSPLILIQPRLVDSFLCLHANIVTCSKESFGVLDHHHQQNRPNKPPSVSRLTTATVQQKSLNDSRPNIDSNHASQDSVDDEDESNSSNTRQRAPRHSKSQEASCSPTTIQYYPGGWKIVLERAKNRFVRHVFLQQGFPTRDEHLDIAGAILHEEIARGQAENLTLDNG